MFLEDVGSVSIYKNPLKNTCLQVYQRIIITRIIDNTAFGFFVRAALPFVAPVSQALPNYQVFLVFFSLLSPALAEAFPMFSED